MGKQKKLDGKLRCLQSLLQQLGANVACDAVSEARDALGEAVQVEPFGWWVETKGDKPDDTARKFVRDPKFIETLQSHGLETAAIPLYVHVHNLDIKPKFEALAQEHQQLRDALAALVGSGDVDELRGMELAVRQLPAPDEDKAATINAIHALIATQPTEGSREDGDNKRQPQGTTPGGSPGYSPPSHPDGNTTAQSQGAASACPHHVRYPHPCRECEDAKPADSGLVGDAEVTRACNAYFDALPPSGGVAADREAMRAAIAALAAQGHGDAVAKVRHFDYCGIARNGFSQEAEMLDVAPVLPDGTLLYTRLAPPASPAGMPDGWDSVVSDALAILKDVAQFHGQLPVGMYQHIQPRLAALLTATPSAPSTDAEVSHD